MKLFIISALIAVSAAARLEHLERGYLPPNGAGAHGSFGAGAPGSSFGAGAPGAGISVARDSQTSNQYLPPHGSSGLGHAGHAGQQFQSSFGSAGQPAPGSQYGTPQFGNDEASSDFTQSGNGLGAHGHSGSSLGSHSGFGGQSGSHSGFGGHSGSHSGFGGQSGSHGFGSQSGHGLSGQTGSHDAGSQAGFGGQYNRGSQSQTASNQYLPPFSQGQSSFQNIPQQQFDEKTGYIY